MCACKGRESLLFLKLAALCIVLLRWFKILHVACSESMYQSTRDRRYYRYRIDIVRLSGLSLSLSIEIAHPWVSVSISSIEFLNVRSQSQYRYRISTPLSLSLSLSIEYYTSLNLSIALCSLEIFDTCVICILGLLCKLLAISINWSYLNSTHQIWPCLYSLESCWKAM